jgi:hypothetical protein
MRNFYFFTFLTMMLGSSEVMAQGPWTFTNDNEIWASTGTTANIAAGAAYSTLTINGAGNPQIVTTQANVNADLIDHVSITIQNNSDNLRMRFIFKDATGTSRYVDTDITANDSEFKMYTINPDYIYSIATKQNIQQCKVFPTRAVRDKRYKFIRNYNSMEVVDLNYGSNPIVNEFIRIGAASFPNVPFEELYDLENDPYQEQNLINNPEFLELKNRLSVALENWMITQDDFLLKQKMPLIKPTLHPLDRNSKWNNVSADLEHKLNESDYYLTHY